MKKYEVTLYYHTSITVEVDAKDENDAIENAYVEAEKLEYDQQFFNNLQSDGSPDVKEVEDQL